MDRKTTYLVKVAVVGDTGVGKSSVSDRFARNRFSQYAETTIGAAFLAAAVDRPQHKVKFQIWDTAGQERYRALAPLYYRNAHVIVIVCDITSQSSFRSAKSWRANVESRLPRKPIYVLVGNKSDLAEQRTVSRDDADEFADNHDMVFAEVSAKTGAGVHTLFEQIADQIPSFDSGDDKSTSVVILGEDDTSGLMSYCCSY
jgi:small GTP-binding protein